jgi:PIN domain nuclease of toxin-antitoxin system
VLLDTHAFLVVHHRRCAVSARARAAISDAADVFLSVASCLEMAIKVSRGKLTLASPLERFLPDHLAINQIELLHIDLTHVTAVARLPFHHADPFDRLLAAQAAHEKLAIVSSHRAVPRCGLKRIL